MANKYFKLGKKATSFHDPKSGLNLAGDEVAEIDAKLVAHSKTVRNAITGGHIVEVEAEAFTKKGAVKAPVPTEDLEGKRTDSKETPDPKKAPNYNKTASVSPSGSAPGAGGTTGIAPGAELDEDDIEEAEEEVKAPKKKKKDKDKAAKKKSSSK